MKAIQVKESGPEGTVLEVSFPALPPPENAYHADWYQSEPAAPGGGRFVFGKMGVTRRALSTVLEISFSANALKALVQTLDARNFIVTLRNYVQKEGLSESRSTGDLVAVVSSQTKEHSMVASFAFMGFVENDASVSLYRLPPGAEVQYASDLSRLPIIPLVRIDTSAGVLLAFCEDVKRYAEL